MPFYGSVELRGLNGKTTVKRWKLQQTGATGADFIAAQTAFDNIVTALSLCTSATVQDVTVSYVVEAYNVGLGKLTDNALLNVWAEDPANAFDALALSQQYIPAPVIGLFVGSTGANMDIVDVNDTDLHGFIDALAAGAFISDHEVIDTGTAVNGIENGRRITRKS